MVKSPPAPPKKKFGHFIEARISFCPCIAIPSAGGSLASDSCSNFLLLLLAFPHMPTQDKRTFPTAGYGQPLL